MRMRPLCLSVLVLAMSSGAALSGRQAAAIRPVASHAATAPVPASLEAAQQTVTQTCVGCHSDRAKSGGLSLEGFNVAAAGEHAEIDREDDPQAARRADAAGRQPRGPTKRCSTRWPTRSKRQADARARRTPRRAAARSSA